MLGRKFKTKESRVGLVRVPLFLRPNIIDSVPCDRIVRKGLAPKRSIIGHSFTIVGTQSGLGPH